MVPSPKTVLTVAALALAVRETIQDSNAPKIVRDKLARLAAELRDRLQESAPDKARTIDGIEAEAVILAFAESSPQTPPD